MPKKHSEATAAATVRAAENLMADGRVIFHHVHLALINQKAKENHLPAETIQKNQSAPQGLLKGVVVILVRNDRNVLQAPALAKETMASVNRLDEIRLMVRNQSDLETIPIAMKDQARVEVRFEEKNLILKNQSDSPILTKDQNVFQNQQEKKNHLAGESLIATDQSHSHDLRVTHLKKDQNAFRLPKKVKKSPFAKTANRLTIARNPKSFHAKMW